MRRNICLICLLMLVACGGSGGDSDPAPSDDDARGEISQQGDWTPGEVAGNEEPPASASGVECSVATQNRWVDDNMRDYYLFHDLVPVVDLADHDSPEAIIVDLRVQPVDKFSRFEDIQTSDAFFEEGREVWFGYQWERHSDGTAKVAFV